MLKKCTSCKKEIDINLFGKNSDNKDGKQTRCKECIGLYLKKYNSKENSKILQRQKQVRYRKKHPEKYILLAAKYRATKFGIAFNLEESDIIIPNKCPVLDIIIEQNFDGAKDNSPSIDRIDNNLGYIKGNIIIVSNLANRIKTDTSIENIGKVYNFYKKLAGDKNGE